MAGFHDARDNAITRRAWTGQL